MKVMGVATDSSAESQNDKKNKGIASQQEKCPDLSGLDSGIFLRKNRNDEEEGGKINPPDN